MALKATFERLLEIEVSHISGEEPRVAKSSRGGDIDSHVIDASALKLLRITVEGALVES